MMKSAAWSEIKKNGFQDCSLQKNIAATCNDLKALEKGLEGADVLFHVAAIVKAPTKKEFTQANVDATENLVRLAQKKGVKNMVISIFTCCCRAKQRFPKNRERADEAR
ncbi:MAG: polysaccharide biosynthesis protein [Gracilimonas sp.]|nr:polysaccharide biosynthesis protein [Gracilimonas sp.]